MCAVLDDGLCTLHRTLATQVGNTLFCHDDIHVVLGGVLVGDERNDAGDAAALCHRRTSEDTQIGVADEVTRTADTVHHLCTTDMGRVGITIDIHLDGGIDGDDTQTTDNGRVVGYLTLTQRQVVLEIVHIVIDLHQTLVRDSQ